VPDGRTSLPYPFVAAGATDAEMYVSDGVSVLRTSDGGCSWRSVFELSALNAAITSDAGALAASVTGRIDGLATGVAAGSTRLTATSVYVVIRPYENFSEGGPAVVAASHDSGVTWRIATVAASCDGMSQPFVTTGQDFVYAAGANAINLAAGALYPSNENHFAKSVVSTDGGATWTCTADPGGGPLMRADPLDARTLVTFRCYANGSATPVRSTDGGAHWTAMPALPLPPRELCYWLTAGDVARLPRGATRLATLVETNPEGAAPPYSIVVDVSPDGRTWQSLGKVLRDLTSERALGLTLRYDGAPMVVVGVGIVQASAPTGYVVRTWSSRKRAWVDGPPLGVTATGCAGSAIQEVGQVTWGDALRTSMLMLAKVDNGCPPLLVRYRG
jgi:hypothetical protein